MTNLLNTNLLPTANSSNIISPTTNESSSNINSQAGNESNQLHATTTTTNSTTNTTISNSNNSNSQETCLICGDVASGKHYGLRSCEACKAFFKRTVQGKIEYSCPATKECEINKRRRKACQACRFQKCLNMGMLKEGVRLDRVRGGRQKYRQGNSPTNGFGKTVGTPNTVVGAGGGSSSSSSNTPTAAAASFSSASSSCSTAASMAMNGTNQAHLGSCQQQQQRNNQAHYHHSTTAIKQEHSNTTSRLNNETAAQQQQHQNMLASNDRSFENQIMTALINCEPEELVSTQLISSIPSHLNLQMKTLYILSDLFDRELVSLIGWAKQIPGFSEQITLNDQMRLLQSTWAEVIALSIGYRSYLRRLYGNGCNTTTTTNATPSPSSLSPASTSSYNSNSNNSTTNCLNSLGATTTTAIANNNNIFDVRLAFAKDLAIDLKQAINCGAEEIFYNCAQLIKRLEYLKMKQQEYILLKAISLTNADVRLENPSATFRLRDLLMEALSDVTSDRSSLSTSSTATPPPPHMQPDHLQASASTADRRLMPNHRLNEILLCLPVLRQIDSSIRKFWNDIRKGPNNVPMNKLFEEMLEPCQKMYRSEM